MSKPRPTSSDEIAPVLRRVIERMRKTGESYEMASRWLLHDLREAGFTIEPPKPFNDWGRIG